MTELTSSFRHQIDQTKTSQYTRNHLNPHSPCSRPKVGQILLDSGMVKPPQLHHALKLAEESKQPVGRMLVGLGYVGEAHLELALLAQSLIREGTLSAPTAIATICAAAKKRISFNAALQELDELDPAKFNDGELSGLLVASGTISRAVYDQAKRQSEEGGLPLGRTLLLTQVITLSMLDTAVTVVVMMRDGLLTREQAISVLHEVRHNRNSIGAALKNLRIAPPHVASEYPRLGELLCRSRVVSEYECIFAAERAVALGRMLGQEMVYSGIVAEELIDEALKLQRLVQQGVIVAEESYRILESVASQNCSVADVAMSRGSYKETPRDSRALALCIGAGIISSEAVSEAVNCMADYCMGPSKSCLAKGFITKGDYDAALRLVEMLKQPTVSLDQASACLRLCSKKKLDVETALASIGLVTDNASGQETLRLKCIRPEQTSTEVGFNAARELLPLISLIVAVVAGAFASYTCLHVDLQIISVACLAILATGFISIGCCKRTRQSDRHAAQQQTLTNALETKARLTRQVRCTRSAS